jgi:DNA-binding beta-propeller fold protein YncE
MRAAKRIGAAAAAGAAALLVAAGSAAAAGGANKAVFVQTDELAGNHVVAYQRASNGTLTEAGDYATGGLGGQLEGSEVDHLASQDSLVYDQGEGLLLAVNAGSNTISVFGVYGDRLALRQVLPSGGTFPVSIAEQGGIVYVLNALSGGSLQGFQVIGGRLQQLPGSTRALGLSTSTAPVFVHTPGEVAFSPNGSQLIVTTKAGGEALDVFQVGPTGGLSASATVDALAGTVPFAVQFDRFGNLILSEAGTDALASVQLLADGEANQLDQLGTGQAATCWVARDGEHFFASNAGSASVSTFGEQARGNVLTSLAQTPTGPGTVDGAVSGGGRFLYVQTGGTGTVDEFEVGAQGALTSIGSVLVPGAVGGEGIVAP